MKTKLKTFIARVAVHVLLWSRGWKYSEPPGLPYGKRWWKKIAPRGLLVGDWRYAVHQACQEDVK